MLLNKYRRLAFKALAGRLSLVVLAILPLAQHTPATQSTIGHKTIVVISGASVFNSKMGAMLPGRTIVIEGERIRSVGADPHPSDIPSDATMIDARGKYIIPGLIDAHVHLVHVLDYAHITGDEILPLFLANGVTSVRDVGDEIVAEKLISRYAEAHPGTSPRVFLCSPFIDGIPPFHQDNGVSWGVTDPNEVPAFVADMAAWGAITLKLYVGTKRPVGQKVIQEAHRRGMVVTAHLYDYSAQDAVADGIDSLEHIESVFNYIFPPDAPHMPPSQEQAKMTRAEIKGLQKKIQESRAALDLSNPTAHALIEAIVQRKVMVDPTLVVFHNMLMLADLPEVYQSPDNASVPGRLRRFWPGYGPQLKPETQELRRRQFKKYEELTGLLFRSGVLLLCGTDTPEPYVPPGFSMHQELQLLVESGLPPSAALQAATIRAAQALKQDGELGSIEDGKLADLVILDANPLSDIRNTRKINKVMRGGVIADPVALLKTVPAN